MPLDSYGTLTGHHRDTPDDQAAGFTSNLDVIAPAGPLPVCRRRGQQVDHDRGAVADQPDHTILARNANACAVLSRRAHNNSV